MSAQPILIDLEPSWNRRLGPAFISEVPNAKALKKGVGMLKDFDFTLNPYIGCAFGCSYCYAAAFVADEEKREDWGKWVEVKTSAAHELRKTDLRNKRVYMSSATDPYQPVEAHTMLTRSLLEAMLEPFRQPMLTVQTRSPLVTRDIDLLKRFDWVQVNMSVTTDCDDIRRAFEPSCPSIERRLEAVQELKDAGIRTQICLAPLLPLRDATGFGKRLRELAADRYVVGAFHDTDRKFAASTRDAGLRTAREWNWDYRSYRVAVSLLRKELSHLSEWS
ncbi:MAG: radical SAM protein [Armatimonadetes bacterium]|nr:radical SAM protein [Armatimonadota bacterium]